MQTIITYSLIASVGICIITAFLGNFIVWKKTSYIGDAIGHSSLLGVAIGMFFNQFNLIWIILICFCFSLLLNFFKNIYYFTYEALIVVVTQIFLALGLLLISFYYVYNGSNNFNFFLGNILLISVKDIITIFSLVILTSVYLKIYWEKLILIIINEDLAISEGINIFWHNLIFTFLISTNIAFLVQFIGVLLIPSLLIIPALAANILSNKISKIFLISFIISYSSIILGTLTSFFIDIAVSPIITLFIALEFFVIITFSKLK